MTLFHYFSVYPVVVANLVLDLFFVLTLSEEKINHTNPTENNSACLVWVFFHQLWKVCAGATLYLAVCSL